MRITDLNRFTTVVNNLFQVTERMLATQEKISSGKEINKPSDNPVGMIQILGYRSNLAALAQYRKNLQQGQAFLNITESALNDMENLLSRAKEIAVAQSTATATAASRLTAAEEVDSLFEQAVALANTKLGDRYIFSGFETASAPFSSTGAYSGDSNAINIQINESSRMAINLTGDLAFKGSNDLFAALDGLRNSLQTNNVSGIQSAIDTTTAAHSQVVAHHTDIGARLNRIEITLANFARTEVDITRLLSDTEDLDITKAITELASRENAYQASLMAGSKIMQTSLIDFLR